MTFGVCSNLSFIQIQLIKSHFGSAENMVHLGIEWPVGSHSWNSFFQMIEHRFGSAETTLRLLHEVGRMVLEILVFGHFGSAEHMVHLGIEWPVGNHS